ncbi:hypothetical protein, partial [Weizmannia acidilactici]|uniref:hypothetical protein n=1 Tax=Weizmannia acidilactici TaxID=2607726 RepID=UPI001C12AC16
CHLFMTAAFSLYQDPTNLSTLFYLAVFPLKQRRLPIYQDHNFVSTTFPVAKIFAVVRGGKPE